MLRLRPYKVCDAKTIVTWVGDEVAFRKWCADRYDHYPISADDMNALYDNVAQDDNFYQFTAFEKTGIVGHLIMRFTDEEKKVLRFGFVIVDPDKRGKGYGKEMLELAIKYAFEILKTEKITLAAFDNNPEAIRCYKSVGFKEVIPDEERPFRPFDEDWKRVEMEIERC